MIVLGATHILVDMLGWVPVGVVTVCSGVNLFSRTVDQSVLSVMW